MYYLSSMLPYELEAKEAKEALPEFQLLLNGLQAALESFQSGHLEKFDSLVGENACQIRALWVILIVEKHAMDFDRLLQEIDQSKQTILECLEEGVKPGSFSQFLKEKEIDVFMPIEAYHLTQLYLLTQIKVQKGDSKETTDPKRLQALGDVTVSSARRLISKLRKEVAATSVELIKECAKISASWDHLTVNHNECWPCLPMFLTYQTILATSRQKGIPIVIHVQFHIGDDRSECLEEEYLYYTSSGEEHILTIPTAEDHNKPAILIQGVVSAPSVEELPSRSSWKNTFTSYLLSTVILAGAADHRQYPDPAHEHLVGHFADSEFYALKTLAQEKGFSIDNPSTFLIRHVYPTQRAVS
ncbi:MAG: hypothetical protein KBC64_07475 [Simkaniaceae bacterium]|nr:hypothetical protein [Simkaniaceae bacterium]